MEGRDEQEEFMKEMIVKIQKSRRAQFCCECCCGYWLFVIIGIVFGYYVRLAECGWLTTTGEVFLVLVSIAIFMRIIDGIMIILPLSKSTLHCATSFHYWNYNYEWWISLLFLIFSTVFWFFYDECTDYHEFLIWFLALSWIAIIIWKCIIINDK
ncbi:hypothetical protein pb186bvf_006479 [Paramecium bursaria]